MNTSALKRLLTLAALLATLPLATFAISETGTDATPCWTFPFLQNAPSELGLPDAFSDEFREQYKREMSRLKKNCATEPPAGINPTCVQALAVLNLQARYVKHLREIAIRAGIEHYPTRYPGIFIPAPHEGLNKDMALMVKAWNTAERKYDALYNAAKEAGYIPGMECRID